MTTTMKYYFCLIILFSLPAMAEIYVTEDEHGNKVYSNTPPLDSEKAETIDVDTSKTTKMHQSGDSSTLEDNDAFFEQLKIDNEQREQERKEAKNTKLTKKERVEAAKKNLEEAKQLRPGDYIKNVNGSIRYTEDYHERINAAEKALKKAKN